MKLLLLVSIIGFVQLCSTAPATTKKDAFRETLCDISEEVKLCSIPPEKTEKDVLKEKLGDISNKVKAIPAVNSEWIDELIDIFKKYSEHNPYSVQLEIMARFYSLGFDLDFTQVNNTIHKFYRDTYGFGVDIPTENRTYHQCLIDFVVKSNSQHKSREEIRAMDDENFKKFKSTLTKGLEATKSRDLDYYLQIAYNILKNRTAGGVDANFIDILASMYHIGAGVSKSAACGVVAEVFEWRFDCNIYANEEKDDLEAENGADQSRKTI
ncbi:uncharacterized protein LOC129574589 isoform X2 [Sitodiplosis mosellana]|uniref:uncharacterized protein LOC129574589 isoform X2 n=1 Tax=Sitodiplosis mosellana TaxID=263140 RepID=UPI0024438F85|nr:uncharacterized protein LOC129574589 isoform X2 [Sitodiplosis mosellana]